MAMPTPILSGVQQGDDTHSEDGTQEKLKKKWESLMGRPRPPLPHTKTSVLMLHWDKDCADFDVSDEVAKLEGVFKNDYHFNVTTKVLNTKTFPQQQAFCHLSSFVNNEDTENGLLIVYYAGHGGSEANSLGHITLSPSFASGEQERRKMGIEWPEVERTMAVTAADVLVIFDCCHAGLLCTPVVRSHSRAFEYIGACAANQRTPVDGENSFTSAMIWALKELSSKQGFYTNELIAKIRHWPNFVGTNQDPQLYSTRYEVQGQNLYIAPATEQRDPEVYREEYNARMEEEFLQLQVHYDGQITDKDVENIARVLQKAKQNGHIRHVALLGKWSITSYDVATRQRIKRALAAFRPKRNPPGLISTQGNAINQESLADLGANSLAVPEECAANESYKPTSKSRRWKITKTSNARKPRRWNP